MRARYMPYGLTMLGSRTDRELSGRPSLANSRDWGVAGVMPGTSTPARRMLNTTVRPRKLNLASVYPVSPDSPADSAAPTPAYSAVLAIQCQYTPPRYAERSRML